MAISYLLVRQPLGMSLLSKMEFRCVWGSERCTCDLIENRLTLISYVTTYSRQSFKANYLPERLGLPLSMSI